MRERIKRWVMYPGSATSAALRAYIAANRRPGWPYCPPDEGEVLARLAAEHPGGHALEVGFATGSSAGYILSGTTDGRLTSIDYDQDNHEREGVRLIREMGLEGRHQLIEANSLEILPTMHQRGDRYDLVFLDGWKTFDHVWVDTFFCARMLKVGGHIMFDDARMPAVRKCISLLERYYGFQRVDHYAMVGGWRQRLWHLLTNRTLVPPYVALRKPVEISETPAGRQFDFWRDF